MMCGIHRRTLLRAWIARLYCRPMPSTEVPTSPPGRPPEPFTRRKRVRYEELDPDELLHLIDRLEDERSRALRREGIWISFIAHLLLFWFLFYGPKFRSHQPHVVNPSDNKKDLTYLDLPPDAQKQVKPQSSGPAFGQEPRRAIAAIPRSIARPCNSLRPCAGQDRHSRSRRNQHRSSRLRPPLRPSSRRRLNPQLRRPRQRPPSNRCSMSPSPRPLRPPGPALTPARKLPEMPFARRNGMLPRGEPPRATTDRMPPPSIRPWRVGPDILSDTMGVDFGPYMRRVIAATYRSWIPIIPESARPPLDKQGRVGVRFKIYPDGSVKEMILEFPSGDVSLDRAAWGGITGASPYPPLPKGFQRKIPGAALRLLLQPGPGQVSLRERAALCQSILNSANARFTACWW